MSDPDDGLEVLSPHSDHPRLFQSNKFVYPVLSRRSQGISVGVNLNPDKVCNFDCIYCQVDRRSAAETRFVETERLLAELDQTLDLVETGRALPRRAVLRGPRGAAAAQRHRLLRRRRADDVPQLRRDRRGRRRAQAASRARHVKMVLITNASMFHRPTSRRPWRSWTRTTAKSGPSSKPGPRRTSI